MKVTSVKSFKLELLKQGNELRYSGQKEIKQKVIVKQNEYKLKFAIIEDVFFKEGLILDKTGDLGAGLKFKNCSGKILFLSGCEITHCSDSFDFPKGAGLILDNCQFEKVIISENVSFNRNIVLRKNSKIGYLEIRKSSFDLGSIIIENSEINQNLRFSHLNVKSGITFESSKVNTAPRIDFVKTHSISILRTQISGNTILVGCDANLTFNESTFDDGFRIQSCSIKLFTSNDDTFKKGFLLETKSDTEKNGFVNEIYIQNTFTGEEFEFRGFGTIINTLKIPCTNLLSGNFKFDNFNIDTVELTGINKNTNITFSSCSFGNLMIKNFHNFSALTFSDCKGLESKSKINLNSTDLVKTLFINFDFKSFSEIEFINSFVSNSQFSGCQFFEQQQLFKEAENKLDRKDREYKQDKMMLFRRRKEIFRQFKHAAEKQGDKILSIEFKAGELVCFREELKNSKKWWNRDRLMLWATSSNNMGLNWSKPIWLLFGFTIVFYIVITAMISEHLALINPINYQRIDYRGTVDEYFSKSYFLPQMFNPGRNLNRIFEELKPLGFWVHFTDFLHRIVLTFFIFQIVSAFRKYIR